MIKRSGNFVMQNIGGAPVLVPLGAQISKTNGLVTLNETARYIWELLATERSVNYLTAAVAEQFEVDIERAHIDVQVFLDEIKAAGLVE